MMIPQRLRAPCGSPRCRRRVFRIANLSALPPCTHPRVVRRRCHTARGLAPLRPLRTGRETLASSGSYTPASGSESQKALPQTPAPPSLVGRPPRPECRVPSLHRRYPASTVLRTRPPLRLASVLGSSGVCPLEVSLGIEATGSHVPHKSLSLVSRRLHAGRRSASRQASAELCRRPTTGAWFWRRPSAFDTSATVHSRSSDQRTPDGIAPAFCRNAHHLGHWTDAACGGLDPDPAIRARGADPHLLCSKAARSRSLHDTLLAPSWRTVIGVPDQDDALVHPLLRRGLDGVAVAVLAAEEALHPIEGYIRQHGRENSALRRTGLAGAPGTHVDRSSLEPALDRPRE